MDSDSNIPMSSQGLNINSQSFSQEPCTQLYDDTNGSNVDDINTYSSFPNPWATLVLIGIDNKIPSRLDLSMKSNQLKDCDLLNQYNVFSIGRSKKCDFNLISSPHISNKHCILYCKINHANIDKFDENSESLDDFIQDSNYYETKLSKHLNNLEVWITDYSSNGTYVNNTRIHDSRQLHHGDVISFINPELCHKINRRKLSQVSNIELNKNSFNININLPSELPKKVAGFNLSLSSLSPVEDSINSSLDANSSSSCYNDHQIKNNDLSTNNSNAIELRATNSIYTLLNKVRIFDDYYEFRQKLGAGGAGTVFECVQKSSGKRFAVKVIDIRAYTNSSSDKQLKNIIREAEMLRSLRHPNIIHLEDIFSNTHTLYLVMELLQGIGVI